MTDEGPPSILAKAFALLRAFSPDRRVMSLSEIGRASGLPKSTVHRLLARLVELGAVEHHRSGYRIGIAMFQIGATSPAVSMRDVASPCLAALHHRTGFAVTLAVLREFDIVILDSISRRSLPSARSGAGARLPAHCTALGKALLAHEDLDDLGMFLPAPMPALTPSSMTDPADLIRDLGEVRRTGLARESQESQRGVACVATPISVMGAAVGAISVAGASEHGPPTGIESALRDTATRVAHEVRAALAQGRVHWFPREIDDVSPPTGSAAERPWPRSAAESLGAARGRVGRPAGVPAPTTLARDVTRPGGLRGPG